MVGCVIQSQRGDLTGLFSNFDLPDGISVLTLKIIDTYGMRMNKLLTIITLLCFSVAANVDLL